MPGVIWYLVKRIVGMIPLLLGISIISFITIHLTPGDPVSLVNDLNPEVSREATARLYAMYGLDQPLHIQFWEWLSRMATFDFGESFSPDRRPVATIIVERLPITLGINVVSLIVIFAVSMLLGIISAVRKDSLWDKGITVFVFVLFALPGFWIALLCIMFFSVELGWFPVSGIKSFHYHALSPLGKILDIAHHLVLPVAVSILGSLAGISRYMRSSMLGVLSQDYILTARSKGLSEYRVVGIHALRNALIPVITILGLSLPGLIGGSVIFETIFSIPGMGQLFYQSVMSRDYPVVMGILVIGALLTLVGNLLADILYAVADPRIRLAGRP
ncbi:ABC transporter permease [Chrysiogenes arsenatis]|uniref:ABC transporter permease n=1 Tax=Chrysiogenes arsenatis TaxID=309797 RepID=UPI00048555C8|nr:ABC transporter permease [Chrysiogenes arsenatis]